MVAMLLFPIKTSRWPSWPVVGRLNIQAKAVQRAHDKASCAQLMLQRNGWSRRSFLLLTMGPSRSITSARSAAAQICLSISRPPLSSIRYSLVIDRHRVAPILWRHRRTQPTSRYLCSSHPSGRKAGGLTGYARYELRLGDQFANRQDAWTKSANNFANRGQGSDRITFHRAALAVPTR